MQSVGCNEEMANMSVMDIVVAFEKDPANLDGEHGHSVWHVYVVPHTEIVRVLSHHDITERHPLLGACARMGGVMLLNPINCVL